MAATRFTVEAVFSAIDRITRPVNRMENRFTRATANMNRALRRLDQRTTQFVTSIAGAGVKIAAGITAAAGGFLALASNANAATVETDLLAKSVGVSADLLSNLGAAVSPAGFQIEDVNSLVEELNNKFGESSALEITTPVAEALAGLDLDFDLFKSLSVEDQFKTVMDRALKLAETAPQQAASMVDILMGGEANRILGVLRQRGSTIDEVVEQMNRLNFVTEEGRQGALQYQQAMGTLTRATSTLKSEFFGLVGEALTPYLALMSDYIALHKEDIYSGMLRGIESIKQALQFVADNWQMIIDRITLVSKLTAAVFGLVLAFKAVAAVVAVVNAIIAAPFVAVGVTIAALVAGVVLLNEKFDLVGTAADFIYDKWARLLGLFDSIAGKAKEMGGGAIDKFKDFVGFGDEEMGGGAFDKFKDFVGFGADDEDAEQTAPAQMVTPQDRASETLTRHSESLTNESIVTIKDETGRAEKTSGFFGRGVVLSGSGMF